MAKFLYSEGSGGWLPDDRGGFELSTVFRGSSVSHLGVAVRREDVRGEETGGFG